jgi:hypothetical protein
VHRLEDFIRKLRVSPTIFDQILDQISHHPIFQSNSNTPQLPVAIQLAIFLNQAGHYGNSSSPHDIAEWAGVAVGTVIKCTNWVLTALLSQHDAFVRFPLPNSRSSKQAKAFVESRTCPAWRNGFLAVDGTSINLYAKPGYYGETFFDRKKRYSLNCQVCHISLDAMVLI